jgi:hypothetical protein
VSESEKDERNENSLADGGSPKYSPNLSPNKEQLDYEERLY